MREKKKARQTDGDEAVVVGVLEGNASQLEGSLTEVEGDDGHVLHALAGILELLKKKKSTSPQTNQQSKKDG